MKIKKAESRTGIRAWFFEKLLSKKSFIFFSIIVLIVVMGIGVSLGLLFGGVFGSINNPSPYALKILEDSGMNVQGIYSFLDGVRHEHIKIPYNFIKGQVAQVESMNLDIAFEDYQKLQFIRQRALENGQLIASDEDYVPASIRYNDKSYDVEIRLKGDQLDHLKGNKWSFRVKIKGDDFIKGMKQFSLQKPATRGYVNEFIYYEALKYENLIYLRNGLVDVYINGERIGVYIYEEHFDKYLIEHNKNREGPILRFNEDYFWELNSKKLGIDYDIVYNSGNDMAEVSVFKEAKTQRNPVLLDNFMKAQSMLEGFRAGELSTKQVFDIDKTAKFYALSELLGGDHALHFTNRRYYYNPVSSLLEPIGYDADSGRRDRSTLVFADDIFSKEYYDLLFGDEEFMSRYIQYLNKFADEKYVESFFESIEEDLNKQITIIRKDYPWYYFLKEDYYQNAKDIAYFLEPIRPLRPYIYKITNDKIFLEIKNTQIMPIEIIKLEKNGEIINPTEKYILKGQTDEFQVVSFEKNFDISNIYINESMSLFYKISGTNKISNTSVISYNRINLSVVDQTKSFKTPTIDNFDFIKTNEKTNEIILGTGSWVVKEDLIIPKGYTLVCETPLSLDLTNNAKIISFSPVKCVGNEEEKISIFSSDLSGQGFYVSQAKEKSILEHITFSNITSPIDDKWMLTGAVTFYESPVSLNYVQIKDINAEDGLNIINSDFEINNTLIQNTLSDCLDGDFVTGTMENIGFVNCGNDGLDISGSDVSVVNINVINSGDKAISSGENSKLKMLNGKIDGAFIGIASKDLSNVLATDIFIENTEYALAAYQKKHEFGSGIIITNKEINLENNKELAIKDTNSEIFANAQQYQTNTDEVYAALYPTE